jgi:hypothetical protein
MKYSHILIPFLPLFCSCQFLRLDSPLSTTVLYSVASESESYVTTDGQSASPPWNKAPIWGLRPDFYYCQTFAGFLVWDALPNERSGLSFTIAADPRQRSHSQVRVPWDSWPYFTLSDSRLSFSSPTTIRIATVEVFDPASTVKSKLKLKSKSHCD